MKWEHELKRALRDLARATDDGRSSPAVEAALLDAFDARHGTGARASRNARPETGIRRFHAAVGTRTNVRWVLAAAAGVVLLLAVRSELRQANPGAGQPVDARVAPSLQGVSPAPSAPQGGSPATSTSNASAAATTVRPSQAAAVRRPRAVRAPVPNARAEIADDASGEFITLPAAERLPALESGMIVRVELPVTSLPAYGFPIMPDSSRRPVTADVLVGQDGQPRAIRLVGMETGSRRSQ